jgi:hypothetical protein
MYRVEPAGVFVAVVTASSEWSSFNEFAALNPSFNKKIEKGFVFSAMRQIQ